MTNLKKLPLVAIAAMVAVTPVCAFAAASKYKSRDYSSSRSYRDDANYNNDYRARNNAVPAIPNYRHGGVIGKGGLQDMSHQTRHQIDTSNNERVFGTPPMDGRAY